MESIQSFVAIDDYVVNRVLKKWSNDGKRVFNICSDGCLIFLDQLIEDIMLECSLGWQEHTREGAIVSACTSYYGRASELQMRRAIHDPDWCNHDLYKHTHTYLCL